MTGEALLDLLAILHQQGILDEDEYRRAADMLESAAAEAAPLGGPSSVVDRRIGRYRSYFPLTMER
jgi:hypothetical protein